MHTYTTVFIYDHMHIDPLSFTHSPTHAQSQHFQSRVERLFSRSKILIYTIRTVTGPCGMNITYLEIYIFFVISLLI